MTSPPGGSACLSAFVSALTLLRYIPVTAGLVSNLVPDPETFEGLA